MVNQLYIKRMTPNTGTVMAYGRFYEECRVTSELPYKECVAYVQENQTPLTIYKVARILPRKNAVRKLFKKFLALNEDDAKATFYDICKMTDDGSTLQLLTGDWKLIAVRDSSGIISII